MKTQDKEWAEEQLREINDHLRDIKYMFGLMCVGLVSFGIGAILGLL